MWKAAATTGRRRDVLRTASTALIGLALIVPGVGRSNVNHDGPNPPTAVAIVGASPTTVTMTWEAGRGRPAHEFALFKDGQSVASTAERSYTFSGLSCGTSYTLRIQALDSAGNRSDLVSVIAAPRACPAPAPVPTSGSAASSRAARALHPAAARALCAHATSPGFSNRARTGARKHTTSRTGHAICRTAVGGSRSVHLARDRRRTRGSRFAAPCKRVFVGGAPHPRRSRH